MKYITAAQTAKLIRKLLKEKFPATKFYVRTRHQTSIAVDWVDGPTDAEVAPLVRAYQGGGFDGMVDLAYSVYHWMMPDGTIEIARVTHPHDSENNPKPHPDAEEVSFGAKYIFTDRHFSRQLTEAVFAATAERTGWDAPEIKDWEPYISRKKRLPGCATFDISYGSNAEWFARVRNDATHDTIQEAVDKHFPRYEP